MKTKDKVASRKYFLAASTMMGATAMMIVPAILNYFLDTNVAIMTGSEYCSLIIAMYTIYSGANVAEKHFIDLPTAQREQDREDKKAAGKPSKGEDSE